MLNVCIVCIENASENIIYIILLWCVCVRACMRACVRACVCACVWVVCVGVG